MRANFNSLVKLSLRATLWSLALTIERMICQTRDFPKGQEVIINKEKKKTKHISDYIPSYP